MRATTQSGHIKDVLVTVWKLFGESLENNVARNLTFALLFIKYASDLGAEKAAPFVACTVNFDGILVLRNTPGNGERLNEALALIEAQTNLFVPGDLDLGNGFNTLLLGNPEQMNAKLALVLQAFTNPCMNMRPSMAFDHQMVGEACNQFFHHMAAVGKQHARDAVTPDFLAKLTAGLLSPVKGESLADPANGVGSALITLAEHSGEKDSHALYAQEVSQPVAALARMNAVMHGLSPSCIRTGDSIVNPAFVVNEGKLMQFDVQISHPPYATDGWSHEVAVDDCFGRFPVAIPGKNRSDFAFVLHMVAMMSPEKGRMAVIVPGGPLFRGYNEALIRAHLIENNLLDAVIALPAGACYATAIPVFIMILSRAREAGQGVMFINASVDFIPGKAVNTLSDDAIERVVSIYSERSCVPGVSKSVAGAAIEAAQFSFLPSRYTRDAVVEEPIDILEMMARRRDLLNDLNRLENEFESMMTELGIVI